jgi:hypothetical protein
MIYSRISAVFFLLSAASILLILSGTVSASNPFYFWIGFLGFGFLAFLFNVLSVFFDKKRIQNGQNPYKGLVRYLGMFVIFIGFTFKIFHFPYSSVLLLTGIVLTASSIFMKSKIEKNMDSNILDEDI